MEILSSYGIGNVPTVIPSEDVRTEAELSQGRLEKEKETKIIEKTNERLRDLAPTDQIYEAMENFLLGDPENQIPLLGEPGEIIGKGNEAKEKGEDLVARAQYETMAKVAIYKQDKDLAKSSLEYAEQVTDPADRHARMQRTILENLDQVIGIAKDYYRTKEEITAETEAEIEAVKVAEKK
jgi:hypothetical protein